jgi:hypothetical protein
MQVVDQNLNDNQCALIYGHSSSRDLRIIPHGREEGQRMDISYLSRKDFGLPAFAIAFILTVAIFKLSSLLSQFGLYFQWSTFFNYNNDEDDNYNLWAAFILRFIIPAGVGFIASVFLRPDMRASVTAGVFFSALFLVWPAILDFENVIDPSLYDYKAMFFFFYGVYLLLFPLAAYGGFSMGARLSPYMPKVEFSPGETIKISLGRHVFLPLAISLSGNLIASSILRDFAMRVLGAK